MCKTETVNTKRGDIKYLITCCNCGNKSYYPFRKNCWICNEKLHVEFTPQNHAPDKVRGLDKPEKGQALGLKPQHAADGNELGLS